MLKKTNKVTRLKIVELALANLVKATKQVISGEYARCPSCNEGWYPKELVGTGHEPHVPFCALVKAREVVSND